MMSKVGVVDSSCLIGLWKIGQIHLLQQLFARVVVPDSVQQESDIFLDWFEVRSPQNEQLVRSLCAYLGKGGSDVIALGGKLESMRCSSTTGKHVKQQNTWA
jgi:predicted nucleic acid-binding protein